MAKYKLNSRYKAVVIGGSAGSFQPITKLLSKIPKDFPLPIFLCLHRLKHVRHGFVEALSIKSSKPVSEPLDKEPIKRGQVYLAPANYHMLIELGNSFALSTVGLVNNSRPAIDLTFQSAAYVYKEKLIGILFSGANKDGALGMKSVKDYGGLTVIQDIEESMINTMPSAAQSVTSIDYMLKTDNIIDLLLDLHKYHLNV